MRFNSAFKGLKSAAATRLENAWSLITSPTVHRHTTVLNYSTFQADKTMLVLQGFWYGLSVTLG
jgi:hypothetical protein